MCIDIEHLKDMNVMFKVYLGQEENNEWCRLQNF